MRALPVRQCLLIGVFILTALAAVAQQPNADDLIWQKAVAKYDGQRAALLKTVDQEAHEGPFQPNWDSLKNYKIPDWYQDAKFGIFIHWGLYSVPAFGNEWYPRNMYVQGSPEFKHHVETYGPQTKFGYKDFIPMFHAEHFDPAAWAALFKESGAKYVIPVAEHHDGFPMYDTGLSDWSAAKMGPKRDLIGDLATAIRAEGLHLGASSHRAEHYWFLDGGRMFPSDVQDPEYAAFYGPAHIAPAGKNPGDKGVLHPDSAYLNDWLARSAEIVEKYNPELVYFDWWVEQPEFQPYLQRFAAFYYNRGGAERRAAGALSQERCFSAMERRCWISSAAAGPDRAQHWQTDTSISNASWGYVKNDTYKSAESIVWQLVDIVSKNGNLLLNIGPKSDGTIPEEAQTILRQIGAWLNVNGDAIYGTRPWTTLR